MSNKTRTQKTQKETQIGNFIVSTYGSQLKYVKVSSVSGHWSETFRSDTMFYKLLIDVIKSLDENSERYLQSLFTAHMITSEGLKDWVFIQDVYEAYNRMIERGKKNEEISEEENKEIINELKEKHENGNN